MELSDLLEKVDNTLYQFSEYVTNACRERFGWDKYTLMNASSMVQSMGIGACGATCVIDGLNYKPPSLAFSVITGTAVTAFAIWRYYHDRRETIKVRADEPHQGSGSTRKPAFGDFLVYGMLLPGTWLFNHYYFQSSMQDPSKAEIAGLIGVGGMLSWRMGHTAREYFRTQPVVK